MFDGLLQYDLGAGVDRPNLTREDLDGYDAFVTNMPGVAIGVRTADCIPVLLYDPVKRVVAAVHAGWKGTVLHISQKAIHESTLRLQSCRYEGGTGPRHRPGKFPSR